MVLKRDPSHYSSFDWLIECFRITFIHLYAVLFNLILSMGCMIFILLWSIVHEFLPHNPTATYVYRLFIYNEYSCCIAYIQIVHLCCIRVFALFDAHSRIVLWQLCLYVGAVYGVRFMCFMQTTSFCVLLTALRSYHVFIVLVLALLEYLL